MAPDKPLDPETVNIHDPMNPLRKYFDDILPGDHYSTHARTVTEADVVNFACLTGDFYYLHTDREAAALSPYGERIAHGLLVLSLSTGLMSTNRPGPIIANYGVDHLRFVKPVRLGDTIRVHVKCVEKKPISKPIGDREVGLVDWQVRVRNQREEIVARWIFKTLVLVAAETESS